MSGRCCDRNKTIQQACGNLGGKAVRGKTSSCFFSVLESILHHPELSFSSNLAMLQGLLH